jgi:hypothetical protein
MVAALSQELFRAAAQLQCHVGAACDPPSGLAARCVTLQMAPLRHCFGTGHCVSVHRQRGIRFTSYTSGVCGDTRRAGMFLLRSANAPHQGIGGHCLLCYGPACCSSFIPLPKKSVETCNL